MSEIRNIFTIYDDDKSGSLDEEEFTHAMALTGKLLKAKGHVSQVI